MISRRAPSEQVKSSMGAEGKMRGLGRKEKKIEVRNQRKMKL